MTEIKFWGGTYVGTAEGDHGVFTNSDGAVFAGQIAGGFPCVGVVTWTFGGTTFVECDADGKEHGRVLACYADGDTWYDRYEHGSRKEQAYLYNGTCAYNGAACEYNGNPCRADFAPFVALKAMVLPIKARPPLGLPTAAYMPHSFATHRPPVGPIDHCFGTQELATTHADKVRTCRLRHQPAWALRHSNCQTNAPRVQPGRRTGGRVLYTCATTACVVHPSAVRARAANPHAPPLFPSRAARPRGASRPASGCPCRFCTPRAARTRRRALQSRFAPRTCTPAPSHAPNCDARSMRP